MFKFLSFALLLLTNYAIAANDYYQTQVEVLDQSAASRAQVLNKAFVEVLIKTAGTRQVLQKNPLQRLSTADIQTSLERYTYQREGSLLQLSCQFRADAVHQALDKLGIPAWTKKRPQVLAWLYLAPDGIVSELTPDVQAVLQQQAAKRGLTFLLPLMDLEDLQAVNPNQVQQADRNALIKASQRYRPNVIINAFINQSNGQASGSWHIYVGREDITWRKQYPNLTLLLQDSIDIITDTLASRYNASATSTSTNTAATSSYSAATEASNSYSSSAATQSNNTSTGVVIHGIRSLADYAALQTFLQNNSELSGLQIEQVAGSELVLQLGASNDAAQVAQALGNGGLQTLSAPANDVRPHYQWRGR